MTNGVEHFFERTYSTFVNHLLERFCLFFTGWFVLLLLLFNLKGKRESAGTAKGELGFGHLISRSIFHVRIGTGADRLGGLAGRPARSVSIIIRQKLGSAR